MIETDFIMHLTDANCGINALLAYIDPGTGSYIFQMLAAGALTVVITMRNVRCYIIAKFNALLRRKSADTQTLPTNAGPGGGKSH